MYNDKLCNLVLANKTLMVYVYVKRMFQPLPKPDGRSAISHHPRPTCPVSPAIQPPRPPLITEVTHTQAPVQPSPQGQNSIF